MWEASKVKQYIQLSQEEQDRLGVGEKEENNIEDDILNEPIPKTNYCHICRRKFDDYLLHLETMIHKNNINKNQMMITTAKDTFKRINNFWNNKNNNNLNNNLNYHINEKIEKYENSKLFGMSNSSFSSAISTFKLEDTLNKDNNSILDPYNSDNEKSNNKENQSENKNYLKNKKVKHVKNRSHFITPIRNQKQLENKLINNLSSSQSSINSLINRKRKNNSISEKGKNFNFITEEKEEKESDYFPNLNVNRNKKLIRNVNIFFN